MGMTLYIQIFGEADRAFLDFMPKFPSVRHVLDFVEYRLKSNVSLWQLPEGVKKSED